YLASLGPGARVRTLADVIEFNERNRAREMPYFGQEIFHMAQEKGPLTEQEYLDALAKNHRLSRAEGIDAALREHRLDAIVAPTGSPPWTIDLVNGDHFLGASSQPAAVAGYPSITIPAGYAFGLDRKSTRLNSSHVKISYAVFCLKKKKHKLHMPMTQMHQRDQAL